MKNVVVIGCGIGGVGAAQSLASALPPDYRVVVVHESEHAYYPIASLRAATVAGPLTLPLTQPTAFQSLISIVYVSHVVLPNARVIAFSPTEVTLASLPTHDEFKGSTTIPFEYVVMATGATYAFPCRAPVTARTEEETQEELRAFQKAVGAATSILVVGGGPAGVEFAGEVKETFPDKKVTLVHPAPRLFKNWNQGLGDKLEEQLKALGVDIIYDVRIDTGDLTNGLIKEREFDLGQGRTVTADFIFIAHGSRPNSAIFEAYDPKLVDSRGAVRVLPSLQLPSIRNAFAVGDLNDIPENKLAGAAFHQGGYVAKNIAALIKAGGPESSVKLKEWGASKPHCAITIGHEGGAGQFLGWVVGPWVVARFMSRTLGVARFKKIYGVKE
ncbi:hypothetical protein MNV49_005074 [Pseudohyphozyma bogoriensis]|nr:hypothetical protein MNV49_005074 [Pseudohyphozyma bogoriensis]